MFRFTIAYLDPGTGSLLLQGLLGGVAGLAVYLKAKGRNFLGRKVAEEEVTESTDA